MHTLRVAARILLQRPGLTLLVVVTLAFGIGANAAIFGTIDALVLRVVSSDARLLAGLAAVLVAASLAAAYVPARRAAALDPLDALRVE